MSDLGHIETPREKLAKAHLLVLDSDPSMVQMMKDILFTLGFRFVYDAKDGYTAHQVLQQQHCDLIISDADLRLANNYYTKGIYGPYDPDSGPLFVKSVRYWDRCPCPFVPVIMMTGPTSIEAIHEARDAGVSEILMKPLSAKKLIDRLIKIIQEPRDFVTSPNYKGPCRRRRNIKVEVDRRKRDIKVIKWSRQ